MRFRKKPVVIDAIQWTGDMKDAEAISDFAAESTNCAVGFHGENLVVFALEGKMLALPGDWIIKGVRGELYPCKDEIFQATYEAAET